MAKKKPTKKKTAKKTQAKRPGVDMSPPEKVRAALKRGLDLRKDYGGKGLRAHTIKEAQALARGQKITEQKVRKMRAWFSRHAVDKKPGWSRPPTPGYVAWLLWGGDAGRVWSSRLVKQLDRAEA